ncbi:MAG: hypothetical protein Q8S43_07500 [Actinomycetota bacterium]|nr:hypothetical protein [Actinomycetota bacterium]
MAGEGAVEPISTDTRFLMEAKVRAELSAADALCPGSAAIAGTGSLTPAVLLVKGTAGEADISAGVALAGADGEAAHKALDALDVTGPLYAVCSRTVPVCGPAETGSRLRLIIEALDPSLAVALDREAAEDISSALGIPALPFGETVSLPGRTLLAVDGLEASLAGDRKAVVWQQFRGLRRT